MLELEAIRNTALQALMLRHARQALHAACLATRRVYTRRKPVQLQDFEALNASGVFVSLHKDKALRGCIGKLRLDSVGPRELHAAAVDAATRDPRFAPVTADELDQIEIEISLLGPFSPCRAEDIEVGRHGLYLRSESTSGLLLPQVAVDRGWNATEFLLQLRKKAGCGPTADANEELWCFRAVVFDEQGNLQAY